MTLLDILQGLQSGQFRFGEVLESDEGIKFEMVTDDLVKMTLLSGCVQLWRLEPNRRDGRQSAS